MPGHRLLKFLRAAHLYLGVFTAPALLFFAFTGALQSFGLHEAARGSGYKPPMWLQAMAHLHKKQSLDVPVRRAAAVQAGKAVDEHFSAPSKAPPQARNLLPMKIYFALVALSLFISTLTGLYMASRMSRSTRRIAVTLAAGVLVPVLLLTI